MLKESNGNELDTARLKDEWRTKLLTEWQPIDKKRKRGRQLTRWADNLARVAGRDWSRVDRQRMAGKRLG